MTRPLAGLAALLLVLPVRAEDKKPEPATIAHVELTGDLDEAPVGESAFGGSADENLKQKLDRIAKAKADPKVKALILDLHDLKLGVFGFGKVDEVRGAIADFRKSRQEGLCLPRRDRRARLPDRLRLRPGDRPRGRRRSG